MKTKINHYFATYKSSNECFGTADELLFHKSDDAIAHASTLSDKRVAQFDRADYKPEKEGSVAPDNNEGALASSKKVGPKKTEPKAEKTSAKGEKPKAEKPAEAEKPEADKK